MYTRYAPVRHSSSRASSHVTVRLACVRPAASVHPEPGSNSSSLIFKSYDYILTTNRNFVIFVLKMVYSFVCKKPFPVYYLRCQFNMLMNFFLSILKHFSALAGANIKPFFIPYNTIWFYFWKNFLNLKTNLFIRTNTNLYPFSGGKYTTLFIPHNSIWFYF